MNTIAEFTIIGRVGEIKQVGTTCLISPTRPMMVNSAIVSRAGFLFPSPRAFGSCRRSLGCGSREVGRAGPAPARHERAEAFSEGRRRAAILVREEFGLQAEGENRRLEPLRRGLSGFMAALKTRGPARACP